MRRRGEEGGEVCAEGDVREVWVGDVEMRGFCVVVW